MERQAEDKPYSQEKLLHTRPYQRGESLVLMPCLLISMCMFCVHMCAIGSGEVGWGGGEGGEVRNVWFCSIMLNNADINVLEYLVLQNNI